MTWPVQSGKMVKLFGRMLELLAELPVADPALLEPPRLFVSIMFRDAMIISISHS